MADVDNTDLANVSNPASYLLTANKSGGTSSVGEFKVQVKADLINPEPILGKKLPLALVDANYKSVDLNPYSESISPYLWKTRVQGTEEFLPVDTLHFRKSNNTANLPNPCTWADISDAGLLTAPNGVDTSSIDDCFVYYDVQSAKNNNQWLNQLSIVIPSDLIVPAWNVTTNHIKFDATSFNDGIDLTAMLKPNAVTNGLKFSFAPSFRSQQLDPRQKYQR